MLRADLLPFPSFSAGAATAVPPVVGNSDALQRYTPLGQEVARDVQQFIDQGAGQPLGAMNVAQSHWLAMQASRQSMQKIDKKMAANGSPLLSPKERPAKLKPEQQAFLQRIAPWAQSAAEHLGVSVRSVMAHAALESGWGSKPVRDAQGKDAFNLFGIKAMSGWKGAHALAATTEFEAGQAVARTETFRQYDGLDATFADYVQLLQHSPRYRQVLRTGDDIEAFAHGLAEGGYATDPEYARKLIQLSRAIPAEP